MAGWSRLRNREPKLVDGSGGEHEGTSHRFCGLDISLHVVVVVVVVVVDIGKVGQRDA